MQRVIHVQKIIDNESIGIGQHTSRFAVIRRLEKYESLMVEQNGMCQSVGVTFPNRSRRLDDIAQQLDLIEKASDGLLAVYQDKLLVRIQALTQGNVDIDPGRIAQEAAFLADRSDISEEIVRVASHLEQFRRIMDVEEPAGRKLNFLLQEFNREFNTMGAKTSRTEIAHRVVDLKSELEKIREQVQNIE